MKLQELIDKIDVSKIKHDSYMNFSVFEDEFNYLSDDCLYYLDSNLNTRIKCVEFAPHYCTDSVVGSRAYFFDSDCACITYQAGRKCDEVIVGWSTPEIKEKLGQYLLSLKYDGNDLEGDTFGPFNPNEDLGEGYKVEYASQLMSQVVIYDGQLCDVVATPYNIDGKMNFHKIIILVNGEETVVDIRQCLAPYRTH
jgi:hypothetical protein